SGRTSPVGPSEGEGVTEEEETGAVEDPPEKVGTTERTTKRTRQKFGLLGRFRTTAAPATTTTTTTTTEPSTTHAPREPSQDLPPEEQNMERDLTNIYDDCEKAKGCFGFPAGCEGKNNCDMMMTYSKASSGYKFEIMGTINSGYVAAALSDDEKMGSDSVMACRVLNGEVDVLMAYNNGKSNELLAKSKYGLSDIKTLQVDGKVYCTFIRQALTEITAVTFDLDTDTFHLMLATGPAGESGLRYHDNRIASFGSSSLDKFDSLGVSSEIFKTLHACFMIGAWICAASCGIIFARYYKTTWLRHRCCNIDQWFHCSNHGITAIFFGFPLIGAPEWTTFMIIFIAFTAQFILSSRVELLVAILALYFFINWLITAILIVIVAVGEETLKDWGIIFWEE
ncbi:ferric-chelate reductase 1-like 1, partial [Homarus americanus]